jgi:predicted DNA-binding transcriptional regulator YafY
MNRIDRLFAILLLIQRKRCLRAVDLAQAFEVSERTIYRDMTALSESGVPIVALPGTGYQLTEGYYLPPLLFSPDEAAALFLSIHMLLAHTTGGIHANATSALAKIAVILPTPLRQTTERIAGTVQFFKPAARFTGDDPHVVSIQQAIQEHRVARLCYHSYHRDEITERDVELHTLTYANGVWYCSGYCRLRQAVRGFRLSRVLQLRLLDDTFEPRDLPPHVSESILVRVRFDSHIVPWVRERQHYAFQTEEPSGDVPGTIMVYQVQTLAEIVPWLLSWGAAAEPLEPPELRVHIRQEALKLVNLLS